MVFSEMSWLIKLLERGKSEKFMETIPEYDAEKARQVLQISDPHNRPIAPKTISDYSRDMLHEQWLDNGEAFKFSREGMLLDGHHRSHAIIKAALTNSKIFIPVTMIFGLSPEVRKTLDMGKVRSAGDRFKIEMQVDHGTAITGALQLIEARSKGKVTVGGKDTLTVQDILAKYASNRHVYDDVANRIVGQGDANKLGEGSLIAGYLIIAATEGVDIERVRVFFNKLIFNEDINPEGHISQLRSRLGPRQLEKRMRGYRPWEKLELILRYWGYWITERPSLSRPIGVQGSYPKVETGRTPFVNEEQSPE
jgi:hypothetical protein